MGIAELLFFTSELSRREQNKSTQQLILIFGLQILCALAIVVFTWLTFVEKKQIIQALI